MSGGTTAEGYGYPHQRLRAQYDKAVQEGRAFCCETVCVMTTRWIRPGTEWHLAHNVERTGYLGPSHSVCNIAERNRRVARTRKRAKRERQEPVMPWRTSRQW